MTVEPDRSLYGGRTPRTVDRKPRCTRCGQVLAWYAGRPWRIKCHRCGLSNAQES